MARGDRCAAPCEPDRPSDGPHRLHGIADTRTDVSVSDVVIEDDETAVAHGFRGSPTVMIDGRDLEPDTEIPIGSMG